MNRTLLLALTAVLAVVTVFTSAVLFSRPAAPAMMGWCPMCHGMVSLGPLIGVVVASGVVGLAVVLVLELRSPAKTSVDALNHIGLLEEERRVVRLLSSRGPMTQRDIARELGISRVKAHRVIRQLERRGIVVTAPYGNTKLVSLRGVNV